MNVVAFDPSIDTAGAACVSQGGNRLVHYTLLRTDRGRRWTTECVTEARKDIIRAMQLYDDVTEYLDLYTPGEIIIEFPAREPRHHKGQGFTRRSPLTLPTYGMAVGLCLGAATAWRTRRQAAGHPCEIRDVGADQWTKGYPTTREDEDKEGRVRLVETLYGLEAGALGCRSLAGNIADAILMAKHYAFGTDAPGYVPGVRSGWEIQAPPTRRRRRA